MPTAIALVRWTDQGMRTYRETVDRYERAQELARRYDVTMTGMYWTPEGPFDMVCVMEGKDERKLTAFQLKVESMGNFRMTSCQGYGPDEMRELLSIGD